MSLVSIIIPVGPGHERHAAQAIASAKAQTVACETITILDNNGNGAGWARNRGADIATGQFLVFLDADDLLAPDFVERCLRQYLETPQHYIYTDAHTQYGYYDAPECSEMSRWLSGNVDLYHFNTVLMPRTFYDRVGGYDESLTALEDTDFFCKLHYQGLCGERAAGAVFEYRSQLGYRHQLDITTYNKIMTELKERFKGTPMGCKCGGSSIVNRPQADINTMQEGDVLVKTLYPNQQQVGPETGNTYPPVPINTLMPMNEADAYTFASYGWVEIQAMPTVADMPDIEAIKALFNE